MPATDDQQRVLAELEILLLAIRAARDGREGLPPDMVVLGSGPSTGTDSVTRMETAPPSSRAAAQDAGALAHALNGSPALADVPVPAGASQDSALDERSLEERAPHTPVRRVAAIAASLVLGALLLEWAFNGGPPDRPAAPQPAAQSPSADPLPVPPAPAVAPDNPHEVRIDLTTLRRVWLRVTVDGRIVMEREAEAGERVPFGGDRSIVVRAGDAGALLVRVGDGEPAPLGRDGQVVTRAFRTSAP